MIKSTKKGFTLVELIVVIVILGILATIAFITLQDYPIQARDTKRHSDIANLAKKVSIITADGKTTYSDIMKNESHTTAGNYTVYTGEINFSKLQESEKEFTPPKEDEKYKFQYVVETSTELEKCFEFAAKDEQTNKAFTKGNCNPTVTEGDNSVGAELFSTGKEF